jgi:hypothetical protein
MKRIEIENLTVEDLQKMINDAVEMAIKKYKEEDKAPSPYEDITLDKAASELNCSQRTLRMRMKELKIKGFRLGRRIAIQRKDLAKIKAGSRLPDF